MRRKDKEITSREAIDAIIAGAKVCRIAMAKDNIPYVVPMSFGYDGEYLYFHTAKEGRKITFFEANPTVCFEFDEDVMTVDHETIACKWTSAYRSVIGYGKIEEIFGFEERSAAINQIMLHYSEKEWDFTEVMLVRIRLWRMRVEEISGKKSGE